MKIAIWIVFGLLALTWTASAFVAAEVTQWAAALVASGAAQDLGLTATQWSAPAWLAFWVDPAWVRSAQETALWGLQALKEGAPFLGSLMNWLVPLIWVIWAFGVLALLVLTGVAHWLLGRAMPALRAAGGGVRG